MEQKYYLIQKRNITAANGLDGVFPGVPFKILVGNFTDTPHYILRDTELGQAISPPSQETPLQKSLADVLGVNIEETSPQIGAKFIYSNQSLIPDVENLF